MIINTQELFRAHYLGLVRLAMHFVDDQETAEEVVQDVFANLSEVRGGVDDPIRYLRRSVANGSRSVLRRRKLMRAFMRDRPAPQDPVEEPHVTVAQRFVQSQLLDCIRRLPPRQREVVVFRYYEDLSVSEISVMLGISPAAVSSALARAHENLLPIYLEANHEQRPDERTV